MAPPRRIRGLSCDEPYRDAAAKAVGTRARELFDHSRGVLDVGDVERLHDMRVASRRLRAALEVFEPCFPSGRYQKTLREVKAVADALGARRDADVTLAALAGLAEAAPRPERAGIESLAAAIEADQRRANDELAELLAGDRLPGLRKRLDRLVAAAEKGR